MSVVVEPTPNPNAMKFTVPSAVGGPGTYVKGSTPAEPFASDLVELDGVASVFFTSNFVTISKTPDASWDEIKREASAILERHFEA